MYLDPDNNLIPLLPTTVQTRFIGAGKTAFIDAVLNSAWEQALVLYIGDVRYGHQIGSHLRPLNLVLPPQPFDYQLNMVAFHKRAFLNAELPWIASNGTTVGPIGMAWDDSADDMDFRDLRINLVTD